MAPYTIKKVLNSSVVLVTDQEGSELILLGKGIGYGKRPGAPVSESDGNRVFVPVDAERSEQVNELMASVSAELIDVVQRIVAKAESLLGVRLSPGVYLMLADHLNFAIERAQEGMAITNRVFWEIKTYYPDEFQVGVLGLQMIREAMDVELPEDEAANIAFHIANASVRGEKGYDASRYARAIDELVKRTVSALARPIDRSSIHYLRFVTHVKFFVERYFAGKMLDAGDDALFETLSTRYERELGIARSLGAYMQETYGAQVLREELEYLAVHIWRLGRA